MVVAGWITPNLNYLQVGLYSLGSMVFVACMQIARNFAWAFVTKLPRAKDRQLVLGINAAVYMGAKGIGAIASPFLEPNEVHTSAFRTLTQPVGAIPNPNPNPMALTLTRTRI